MSFVKVVTLATGSTVTMPQYTYDILMRQKNSHKKYQFVCYCDEEGDELEASKVLTKQTPVKNARTGRKSGASAESDKQLGTITKEPEKIARENVGGSAYGKPAGSSPPPTTITAGTGKPGTGKPPIRKRKPATGTGSKKKPGKNASGSKRAPARPGNSK